MRRNLLKKAIVSALILAIVFTFAACGENKSDSGNSKAEKPKEEAKVYFLSGSNSGDIVESLTGFTGLSTKPKGKVSGNIVKYEGKTSDYNFYAVSNKDSGEVGKVKITVLNGEDPTNAFMNIQRLEFDDKDAGALTDFIVDNVESGGKTKMGNAKIEISSSNGDPYIEVKAPDIDELLK